MSDRKKRIHHLKKFDKTVDQISEGIEQQSTVTREELKQKIVSRLESLKDYEKTAEQLTDSKKGPGKMPDGFNMKRPAEKLGYIQELGAGRVSPGKMGDMTAMKMMHGDAAAKSYDGAGMHMNGAPKYEGASKSYVGPMTPGHGGAPGHTHGDKTEGNVKFSIGSDGSSSTIKQCSLKVKVVVVHNQKINLGEKAKVWIKNKNV